MGAGRKTETISVHENISWSITSQNSSISARNLRKSDLAGVIFGCTHETITECLSKQLFGLPYGHCTYVKNIEAGLPLFLFNYSDRKLHGIYEASSHGQMYLNSSAWTDGGSQKSPYPAQVFIRIRIQCEPLIENQFKKVIEKNYINSQHFRFELDHAQTRGLIALFKPSRSSMNKMLSTVAPNRKVISASQTSIGVTSKKESVPATTWKDIVSGMGRNKKDQKTNYVNANKFASLLSEDEGSEQSSPTKTPSSVLYNMELKETVSDRGDSIGVSVQNICSDASTWPDTVNHVSHIEQSVNEVVEGEKERVLDMLEMLAAELTYSKLSSEACIADTVVRFPPRDIFESSKHITDEFPLSAKKEDNRIGFDLNKGSDQGMENSNAFDLNGHAKLAVCSNISDLNLGNEKLVQFVKEVEDWAEDLKRNRAESHWAIQELKYQVRDAETRTQFLEDRVKRLESKIGPSMNFGDESLDKYVKQYLGSEDIIYLVGGFNGCSWLSSLDSFSPSLDIITPLKSMSTVRSYTSAVALDGNLFVFGGRNGDSWSNTVECYKRSYDEWTLCPSMLRKKGSLSGATLNGKIFAIGGGDGIECLSNVEIFDPTVGKWITSQSMLHKRFAPAAVEFDGVIYVVGGYDGNEYLRSAEYFDPRVGYWTKLPSMNIRRGSHSLAAFNENLYCIGGYDGEQMVSSIEIFDPRLNSFIVGEPMKIERGYAATVVLGDSLFAVGGIGDDKEIIDTVECFKNGLGWTTSSWKAIGKRSFFSAIVL